MHLAPSRIVASRNTCNLPYDPFADIKRTSHSRCCQSCDERCRQLRPQRIVQPIQSPTVSPLVIGSVTCQLEGTALMELVLHRVKTCLSLINKYL